MRRFLRENSLTLFFLSLLALALVGQAVSGLFLFNQQQLAEGGATVTFWRYVSSAQFAVDVAENWQSEYLQFFLYIMVTTWLAQRGATDSKRMDELGRQSDAEQQVGAHASPRSPSWARAGGLRQAVFSSSLGITMGVIFALSWLGQSVAGWAAYNSEQLGQYQDPVSWLGYVASAEFWNRSLQNWQSEFLAVASMSALSIYLRQRGSPESKPVGATHDATGAEG